ncbi:MAG: zinc-ribbon domain-containing protein [Oscillospiraceae bacterium]|jgi:hypothetical protein|nr:zinc-ribbon domain-containing protein [Oscillospiraceae bacterium]
MEKCKNCGADLQEFQQFCMQCGTPVQEQEDTETDDIILIQDENEETDWKEEITQEPQGDDIESFEQDSSIRAQEQSEDKIGQDIVVISDTQKIPAVDTYTNAHMPVNYTTAPAEPEGKTKNDVISVGGYILSLFVLGIPVIGLIVAIIWTVGGSKNQNRVNLAKAYLVFFLIVLVISLALSVSYAFLGDRINNALYNYLDSEMGGFLSENKIESIEDFLRMYYQNEEKEKNNLTDNNNSADIKDPNDKTRSNQDDSAGDNASPDGTIAPTVRLPSTI